MYARLLAVCALSTAATFALASVAGAHPLTVHKQSVKHVTLIVKSDEEHGKKGSDGKWHDAFLPAGFSVQAGTKVVVTVLNYDDGPHSFNSPGLHVNQILMGGSAKKAHATTFTFVAPSKAGRYAWRCDPNCDPWAMKHAGYMKGYVTVTA